MSSKNSATIMNNANSLPGQSQDLLTLSLVIVVGYVDALVTLF